MKSKPIINNTYILKKHERHKGWVYVLINDIKKVNGKYPKLKVKGTIDDFPVNKIILQSYGKKGLLLPVKAQIRKEKKEGDKVKVLLYLDDSKFEIPEEFESCLKDEPKAEVFFKKLSESEQRLYVLWISSAKQIETKTNRIAKSIERLSKGLKLYEKTI